MPKQSRSAGTERRHSRPQAVTRSRKRLTQTQKAEIAIQRYAGLKESGKLTGLNDLARQYDRHPAVISRAISSAFKENLVEVRRTPGPSQEAPRLLKLEQDLLDRFPQLISAIVIDPVPESQQEEENDTADLVHQQLGHSMARLLATGALLQGDETVGLGSGRGVYYTLDALQAFPPLRARNVTIKSLTGTVYPRAHAQSMAKNLRLDADFHVNLLAQAFADEARIQLASNKIVYDSPDLLRELWVKSSLGPQRWKQFTPTHALLGVGILAPGHRFYDGCQDAKKLDPDGILAPIHQPLKKLINLLDEHKSVLRYPRVADLAHHLFYVNTPFGMRDEAPGEIVLEIQELISTINGQLFTLNEEQLQSIDKIMLVAGTRSKAMAIRELLHNQNYKIRFISTDRSAAEEILKPSAK